MASAETTVAPATAPGDTPVHRRRLTSRLSAGHVVMIVAALLAAVLNYSALRAGDHTVRVAVAARDILAGAPVTADALRFTDARLDDDVLATLLGQEQVSRVEGWIATGTIAAGEPLRVTDLRAPSAPQAQRAMSVPVDPEHAVAGALRRGDRVDVIAVRDGVASYLVTDAEVLAVPAAESRAGLGRLTGFSVTLAVDDEVALALAAALRTGSLDVVRSTGSRAVGGVPGETSEQGQSPDAPGSGQTPGSGAGSDGTASSGETAGSDGTAGPGEAPR